MWENICPQFKVTYQSQLSPLIIEAVLTKDLLPAFWNHACCVLHNSKAITPKNHYTKEPIARIYHSHATVIHAPLHIQGQLPASRAILQPCMPTPHTIHRTMLRSRLSSYKRAYCPHTKGRYAYNLEPYSSTNCHHTFIRTIKRNNLEPYCKGNHRHTKNHRSPQNLNTKESKRQTK